MLGITYDNIERLGNNKTGNMYVLLLTISNIFQGKLVTVVHVNPIALKNIDKKIIKISVIGIKNLSPIFIFS